MRAPKKMAEKVKKELEVVTPSLNTPVSRLSGGNVQKVLVGREIAEAPTVLMTAYAVRGLDINTSYTIYNLLNEEKKEGVAVVYVGEDLDVLIDLVRPHSGSLRRQGEWYPGCQNHHKRRSWSADDKSSEGGEINE